MARNEFSSIKARLTRAEAQYKSQPQWVLAECDRIEKIFDEIGWPDWWSRVERLRQDALSYERWG